MTDEAERLFRHCVHCAADCWADEPEHAETCPSVTGVWPVRAEDPTLCPHCGKDVHGPMQCMDCGSALGVGDHYALRDSETGELEIRPHIGEVICLGCAARLGLAV